MIAGTHSGVGKTTVATGLMAALRAAGVRVSSAKVGPDFIDPSYHRMATQRRSCSLDAFLSGDELLAPLAAKAAADADVLVIEGVMGLFDGSGQPECDGSSAAVATALAAPVVLVIDASALSGSVAALAHGFRSFDPKINLAGVVLNRVGSEGHATLLKEALEPLGVPVFGVVFSDSALEWRERHLGLVPVAEHPDEVRAAIRRLGETMQQSLEIDALVALARTAPITMVPEPPHAAHTGTCNVAVCSGPAFSFTYPENLELLREAGAELYPFDPLEDKALPTGCTGVYAGGGFPELYASALSANTELRGALCRFADAGGVIWAECGGLMWLAESIDRLPMAGVLEGVHVTMSDRLSIGYRTAVTRRAGFFGRAGTAFRAHEFHRSTAAPPGDGLALDGRFGRGTGGYVSPTLFASYLHLHLSATPEIAERFVRAAGAAQGALAVTGTRA